MFRPVPRASGYFRTGYGEDLALLQTRAERISLALFVLILAGFPFVASPFALDLACQVFLASVGALSLMLLTGYAGQISLGHAGLLAAGAFTTGILAREIHSAPKVLVAVQPTRGLDVGAIEGVHQMLLDLRAKGTGILLISEELEELLALADRILVMYEGRIAASFDTPSGADVDAIGLEMTGGEGAGAGESVSADT